MSGLRRENKLGWVTEHIQLWSRLSLHSYGPSGSQQAQRLHEQLHLQRDQKKKKKVKGGGQRSRGGTRDCYCNLVEANLTFAKHFLKVWFICPCDSDDWSCSAAFCTSSNKKSRLNSLYLPWLSARLWQRFVASGDRRGKTWNLDMFSLPTWAAQSVSLVFKLWISHQFCMWMALCSN